MSTARETSNIRRAREKNILKWGIMIALAIVIGILIARGINSLRHYGDDTTPLPVQAVAPAVQSSSQCPGFEDNPSACACYVAANGAMWTQGTSTGCLILQGDQWVQVSQ